MKNKKILDALDSISEKYIDEAAPGGRRTYGGVLAKIAAVAACLCIIAGISLSLPYFLKEPYDHGKVTGSVAGSISEMGSETENLPTDTEIDTGDTAETKWYPVIGGTPHDTGSETEINEDTKNTDSNSNKPAIGGEERCSIHHYTYHAIHGSLLDLVDIDEFEKWSQELYSEEHEGSTCREYLNIKLFIDHFNISREEYEKACRWLTYYYIDLDVLFGGTSEEVDKYFVDVIPEFELYADKVDHYYRTINFININHSEIRDIEYENGGKAIWCIPRLAVLCNIERKELEDYISQVDEERSEGLGNAPAFDYNFDMLYDADGKVILEITDDMDDHELNEMFCRLGKYAE